MKKTIYHYTNLKSFEGILASNELWLSNAFKTNDYLELKWLFTEVKRMHQKSELFKTIITLEFIYTDWLKEVFKPHMICFSSNGDLLSQWRAYSDNGKGVSIGFSRKYLNEIIKTEGNKNLDFEEPEFRFFDLVYNKAKHIKYIDDLLNSIDLKKEVDLLMDNYDHSSVTINRVLKLVIPIYKSCIISKNPNFIEEKETRLVSGTPEVISDQDCLCYRFTDTDMISYVKFPLDLKDKCKSIYEIIIGPKSNIGVKDLENYLSSKYDNGSKIKVSKSGCSYR